VHDVNFQNHGGLTIIHRDSVTVQKRLLDNSVSTFLDLYTYATSKLGRFVLFSLYRPGSQAVSLLFFDELAVAFEQLSAYNCPVIICGDFNIHVDQREKAPVYLSDYCTPVSQVAARQHLRSAARRRLVVPRHRLSTYGRRAFAVAGPMTFNALPDELRDLTVNTTTFRRLLKTHVFSSYLHV